MSVLDVRDTCKFATDVLEALGISSDQVFCFNLNIQVDQLASVTVKRYVTTEDTCALKKVIEKYDFKADEKVRDVSSLNDDFRKHRVS